jgi:hypothetical protein
MNLLMHVLVSREVIGSSQSPSPDDIEHTTTSTYQIAAASRCGSDRKLTTPDVPYLSSTAQPTLLTLPFPLPHHDLDGPSLFALAQTEEVELLMMTDAAAEPLIPANRDYPSDGRYNDNDAEAVEVEESALVSPGLFIWGLTICAGVSGLLFGYEYVDMSCDSPYAKLAIFPTFYNYALTDTLMTAPVLYLRP